MTTSAEFLAVTARAPYTAGDALHTASGTPVTDAMLLTILPTLVRARLATITDAEVNVLSDWGIVGDVLDEASNANPRKPASTTITDTEWTANTIRSYLADLVAQGKDEIALARHGHTQALVAVTPNGDEPSPAYLAVDLMNELSLFNERMPYGEFEAATHEFDTTPDGQSLTAMTHAPESDDLTTDDVTWLQNNLVPIITVRMNNLPENSIISTLGSKHLRSILSTLDEDTIKVEGMRLRDQVISRAHHHAHRLDIVDHGVVWLSARSHYPTDPMLKLVRDLDKLGMFSPLITVEEYTAAKALAD